MINIVNVFFNDNLIFLKIKEKYFVKKQSLHKKKRKFS